MGIFVDFFFPHIVSGCMFCFVLSYWASACILWLLILCFYGLYFVCVCVCVCVFAICMPTVCGGQKAALDPLESELSPSSPKDVCEHSEPTLGHL